jgi:hypothetical protein
MRLAAESHQRIEAFLREHLKSERLRLPPVHIYCGRWSRWLTRTFHILAITIGRRVFVDPKVVGRDERGRPRVPAGLIAHEATHVVQYDRAGFVGFLLSYFWEYWRALREQEQGWGKAARHAAYFAIKQEREAYQAESAFGAWVALETMNEESGSAPPPRPQQGSEPEQSMPDSAV